MKVFLAVDHSKYSERALARLLRQQLPAKSTIRLFMVINPFIPPPAATFCEGRASSIWPIRCRALRRLAELEAQLRFTDFSIESVIYETRIPESIVVLVKGLKWESDHMIAGVHSFFGIRRRLLEAAFKMIRGGRTEPPKKNPHSDPDRGPTWKYQEAA